MSRTIRLFDRSRTATDWQCERRRYWQYEYAGRGIVPDGIALELMMGTCIHDGLAAIATQYRDGVVDIDLIASTSRNSMYHSLTESITTGEYEALTFANEQAALVEGLIRGYYKSVWPKLIKEYPNVINIEQEMSLPIDGSLTFMSKPDLVLGDNNDEWHYIEYKSTSSKRDDWMTQWNTAVQLHSTVKAIESSLGKAPLDVTIIGLYKGYPAYGKQNSPMCYAYARSASPPFFSAQTFYEYKAGLKKIPVWELDGGVKKWVEGMPANVLSDQFPISPPIFVKNELVDNFFKQRATREHEIELAMQMMEVADEESVDDILNVAFPQKFDSCTPSFGRACGYKRLCFGDARNPLEQGFSYRVSHHAMEQEQQQQEDGNAEGD